MRASRLTAVWRSTGPILVVERRQDARGQRRRAASIDQLDQGVKVHIRFAREFLCEFGVEPGLVQPRVTPGHNAGSFLAVAGRCFGSRAHIPT